MDASCHTYEGRISLEHVLTASIHDTGKHKEMEKERTGGAGDVGGGGGCDMYTHVKMYTHTHINTHNGHRYADIMTDTFAISHKHTHTHTYTHTHTHM